jgi:putative ABC transport system ATP-binding protein
VKETQMSETVLEAVDLTKSYGKGANRFDALKGVTLSINRGESLAVVGKSGSGKSTLMHLLALLDRPTRGQVLLDGADATSLTGTTLNKARNQSFGFVFQQFFLVPNTTVLDNVILPLKIAGISPKARKRRGMEVLESLDMADKAKNNATDLSGGQKQRVVIARALINNPTVIFADEPTGNLDTATGEVVEDILFNMKSEHGITLVLVTHDQDLAKRCDRSLFVKDGLLVEPELHA